MKDLICDKEEELYTFLRNNLKGSKNNIKSLLMKELVSVNNKVVTKYNYMLKSGDKINVGAKSINNIKIIYEDKDILVVDKPCGILTIATEEDKYASNNLYEILLKYLKKKNSNSKLFVVHRLDKDTSGIILFSKNQLLQQKLQDKWNDLAKRTYYAVVFGKTNEKDTIKSYLKENKNLITLIDNKNNGKLAITEYKRIKYNEKFSLLEINIKTGRRNQIRVQLKSIGHPIVGDSKYGKKDKNFKRMMLHASKLEIINPINNKTMIFNSPIDTEFKKMLK